MIITDIQQEKDVHAEIGKATRKDITAIAKAKTFDFDWKTYLSPEYELYKLYPRDTNDILGLMCLRDWPERGFQYVEIVTLALRKDQIGKHKRFGRLAGCLFAFAATISMKNGYRGILFLVAKTKTAPIFEREYGFYHIGSINSIAPRMASDEENSYRLIRKYLED